MKIIKDKKKEILIEIEEMNEFNQEEGEELVII